MEYKILKHLYSMHNCDYLIQHSHLEGMRCMTVSDDQKVVATKSNIPVGADRGIADSVYFCNLGIVALGVL